MVLYTAGPTLHYNSSIQEDLIYKLVHILKGQISFYQEVMDYQCIVKLQNPNYLVIRLEILNEEKYHLLHNP
jgi:hypothetical protein